jgi:hypothetical protein
MAGDWIKMRTELPKDPAVKGIARRLGINRYEVVGRLHAVWSWADQQLRGDGNAAGVTLSDIDEESGLQGFAAAMLAEGWLEAGQSGITFPNFARHNGKTAKDRALTAKRVSKFRNAACNANDNAARNAATVTDALPEKRREDISIGNTTSRESTPQKPKLRNGWWADEASILAAGQSLGLTPKPGESMQAYKGRIQARADGSDQTPTQIPNSAYLRTQELLQAQRALPSSPKPTDSLRSAGNAGQTLPGE